MLDKHFERLQFAILRIDRQLAAADSEQRAYLLEELEALRQLGGRLFDLWVGFEDQVQDICERHGGAAALAGPGLDAHVPESSTLHMADIGTILDSDFGLNLFRRGMGYFELFMYDECTPLFKRVLELDPDMTIARLYLGLCHLAQGDLHAADEQLSRVLATAADPSVRAAAREARAQMLALSGQLQSALDELATVLCDRPHDVDTLVNAAICAYALGQFAQSQSFATQATQVDPDDAVAWRLAGASAFAQRQVAAAARCYRHAVQLRPRDADLAQEAVAVEKTLRNSASASAVPAAARAALQRHAQGDWRIERAKHCAECGDPVQAIAQLQEALREDAADVRALRHMEEWLRTPNIDRSDSVPDTGLSL
ncbi:MAG: tetratricopeptide repeat protein [Firmicutes bacterium]|nr:tetratricopeptide repeat protein [Bacillota bacterium]